MVEAAVLEFGEKIRVEKVITRTREGAERYLSVIKRLGRQVAVPSILINGQPVFEKTPGVGKLKETLQRMISTG